MPPTLDLRHGQRTSKCMLLHDQILECLCTNGGASRRRRPAQRVAVIAAHPDDEVVGVGGRLPYWQECHVVYVTDGAPKNLFDAAAAGLPSREAYKAARRAEAFAALALARVPLLRVHGLDFGDQETAFRLPELTHSLTVLLRNLQPDVVITHPYEGGHPDHDATAFAVHRAAALCRRAGVPAPVVIEMTSYHIHEGKIETGEFLPGKVLSGSSEVWTVELSAKEQALKQQMLTCHRTQTATLRYFFTERERFRVAPAYDFTRPPHEGKLFYEHFAWGMTADLWCGLARNAGCEAAVEVCL